MQKSRGKNRSQRETWCFYYSYFIVKILGLDTLGYYRWVRITSRDTSVASKNEENRIKSRRGKKGNSVFSNFSTVASSILAQHVSGAHPLCYLYRYPNWLSKQARQAAGDSSFELEEVEEDLCESFSSSSISENFSVGDKKCPWSKKNL